MRCARASAAHLYGMSPEQLQGFTCVLMEPTPQPLPGSRGQFHLLRSVAARYTLSSRFEAVVQSAGCRLLIHLLCKGYLETCYHVPSQKVVAIDHLLCK
jgi:hypothetical protein